MINDESKALKTTLWFCAGIFLVACVFSVKIVIDALKTPVQKPESATSVELPDEQQSVTAAAIGMDRIERHSSSSPEFMTDYHEIRKMEEAVETLTQTLIEYSANNPDAEDALNAEQIEIIKKEGILFN